MNVARALIRRDEPSVIATVHDWTAETDPPMLPNWPTSDQLTILGAWRAKGVPIVAVDDERIARRYLLSIGVDARDRFQHMARVGTVFPRETLLESARDAADWATKNDTLYDLAAGAFDSTWPEAHEVWTQRIADAHALVRLTACWVAPYFVGGNIRTALEALASSDTEQRVREAAAASAVALRAG